VALTWYAACSLASPEEMNLEEVSSDWNDILLLDNSVRFPACFLPYVKILLLKLTLDIDIKNPPT